MNYAKISELGVLSWRLDADKYETDEELKKIRRDRNYSYMVCFFYLCVHSILLYEQAHVQLLVKIAQTILFFLQQVWSLSLLLSHSFIVRTFARSVQKSFLIMKRRLRTFTRNICTPMRRSVTVWQGVVGLVMFFFY